MAASPFPLTGLGLRSATNRATLKAWWRPWRKVRDQYLHPAQRPWWLERARKHDAAGVRQATRNLPRRARKSWLRVHAAAGNAAPMMWMKFEATGSGEPQAGGRKRKALKASRAAAALLPQISDQLRIQVQ